jgi:type VII secretion protein EccB
MSMQNRRDQAQAHAFVMGRLVSALLRAGPDAPITPLRRFLVGALIGVIFGCIGMVGFGVYGFFVPGGSTAWRTPGAMVVEKETGSRYVLVDGVLRPVLNYASARLILGRQPKVVTVSRNSLRDAPRGLPVGIVGAPDYLPDAGQLTGRHWRVCSALRPDATGKDKPYVILDVLPTPAAAPADSGQALLARTPAGQLYLIADGRRLSIPQPATLGALGYAADKASLVGWAWINAVPAGPDLTAEDIPARGAAGVQIEGRATMAGQLFKVPGLDASTPEQYFVMRTDGLSPLTPLGAALMLADPATRRSYPGGSPAIAELGRATLAGARMSAISSVNEALPATPPTPMPIGTGQAPCLGLAMTDAGPTVGISVAVPPTAEAAGSGAGAADLVVVRPGIGLLARALPAPGVADGTLYVLVDTGVRYPISSVEAATALGYAAGLAVPVPAPILSLIPSGLPLDIAAARATVNAAPPTATPSR